MEDFAILTSEGINSSSGSLLHRWLQIQFRKNISEVSTLLLSLVA